MNHTSSSSGGQLQLIIGPMFSGKSTKLLHAATSYRAIGKHVLIINHSINVRYATAGITTHDCQLKCAHRSAAPDTVVTPQTQNVGTTACAPPALTTAADRLRILTISDLRELQTNPTYRELVTTADVVCIEELQFFAETVGVVTWLVDDKDKHVVCAGLIGDYKRTPFGDILQLVPLADELVHLKALCTVCNDGTPGVFTQRLSTERSQVHVGESNVYRAVCRRHFLEGQKQCEQYNTHRIPTSGGSAPKNVSLNACS